MSSMDLTCQKVFPKVHEHNIHCDVNENLWPNELGLGLVGYKHLLKLNPSTFALFYSSVVVIAISVEFYNYCER